MKLAKLKKTIITLSCLLIISLFGILCIKDTHAINSEVVNVTVPSSINISYDYSGKATVSDYYVTNNSILPFYISELNIASQNNWQLVPYSQPIEKTSKNLSMKLNGYELKSNTNQFGKNISIPNGKKTPLNFEVRNRIYEQNISSQKAFVFNFYFDTDYSVISFNTNGGSNVASMTGKVGSTITLPNSTKTNYVLTGWKDSNGRIYNVGSSYTIPSTNTTLSAQWVGKSFTITLDANGGNVGVSSLNVKYNEKFGTLPIPTRTGYTFDGWYLGNTKVTKDTVVNVTSNSTLIAKWNINSYTLTYNANGGIVNPSSKQISYGSQYGALPTPTKVGYTFVGWYTDPNGGSKVSSTTTIGASNTTIYAHWTAKTYTYNVNYVSSSGKNLGSTTVKGTYGSSITVSAPAKNGYTTPTDQTVKFDSTSAKNITFTYPLINYSISYTLNSGSVSGNPATYNIESSTITLKNPSRTGYTFTGWTGSNGNTPQTSVSILSGSTGNKAYTANYNVNTYTVTFVDGLGQTLKTQSVNYGSDATPPTNPTRTGYTFAGWSGDYTGITGNVTITAKWTINTYTYNVNYVSSSGKNLGSTTVKGAYGSSTTVSAPAKNGYTTPASQTVKFDSTSAKNITFTYNLIEYKLNYDFGALRYDLGGRSLGFSNMTTDYFSENFNFINNESNFSIHIDDKINGTISFPCYDPSLKWYVDGIYKPELDGRTVINVKELNLNNNYRNSIKISWTNTDINLLRQRKGAFNLCYYTNNILTTYNIETSDFVPDAILSSTPSQGWYLTPDNSNSRITTLEGMTGDLILYAHWDTYTYSVDYVSSSGKNLGSTTIKGTYGSSTDVYAPAKNGYTTPDSQTVTFDNANKTIKFVYIPIDYNIKYDIGAGIFLSDVPRSYNIETSVSLQRPALKGYNFLGWREIISSLDITSNNNFNEMKVSMGNVVVSKHVYPSSGNSLSLEKFEVDINPSDGEWTINSVKDAQGNDVEFDWFHNGGYVLYPSQTNHIVFEETKEHQFPFTVQWTAVGRWSDYSLTHTNGKLFKASNSYVTTISQGTIGDKEYIAEYEAINSIMMSDRNFQNTIDDVRTTVTSPNSFFDLSSNISLNAP